MAEAGAARIVAAFEKARGEGRAALMPYMMGGYPSTETALAIAEAYRASGAEIIELGVPFSDPLADGPAIHTAATAALAAGSDFDGVLAIARSVGADVPTVLMVYANMVVRRDPAELAGELDAHNVAGVIVPDLPPEEAGQLIAALRERGLAFIPLVAPTTKPARRRDIAAAAEGFIYVVSDTRTTGERDSLPAELGELVAATKEDSAVPVAVGFGIGTAEQVAEVGGIADGVIVGSRLVRAVTESAGEADAVTAVSEFISAARAALAAG